jgi:hypothetical protein
MQQNLVEMASGKQIIRLSHFDRLLSTTDRRLDHISFLRETSIV